MTSEEYRQALAAMPYGKRLPSAVCLIDPGDCPDVPALLRITVAELRKRLEIGQEFNLLKFHSASPKISFLFYPEFEKDPHPALSNVLIQRLPPWQAAASAHDCRCETALPQSMRQRCEDGTRCQATGTTGAISQTSCGFPNIHRRMAGQRIAGSALPAHLLSSLQPRRNGK